MIELRFRRGLLDCARPLVMGVLNATPDSFSDGVSMAGMEAQIQRFAEIASCGADIIDVGGQSAITGVPEIEVGIEIDRIRPVIVHALSHGAVISVDTYRAEVADAALALGAHIINDISGLQDPEMPSVLAAYGAGYVLMHNPGVPKQRLTESTLYTDVVDAVISHWRSRLEVLAHAGVAMESIILDFGPDFGKTPRQTLECVRRLEEFTHFRRPLLLALSRKDFIGTILRAAPRDRDDASLSVMVLAASKYSAVIARTHRPRATRDAFELLRYVRGDADIEVDERLTPDLWRQP